MAVVEALLTPFQASSAIVLNNIYINEIKGNKKLYVNRDALSTHMQLILATQGATNAYCIA
jgi:hypothetical protein